jgi:hypothetical protein
MTTTNTDITGRARSFSELSPDEQAEVARLLFEAARARCQQWDAERGIERVLGREINIDISEWAVCLTDEDLATRSSFNLSDVAQEFD